MEPRAFAHAKLNIPLAPTLECLGSPKLIIEMKVLNSHALKNVCIEGSWEPTAPQILHSTMEETVLQRQYAHRSSFETVCFLAQGLTPVIPAHKR